MQQLKIIFICLTIINGVINEEQKKIHCSVNEIFTHCISPCPPTCQKPNETCLFLICDDGCECAPGFLRKYKNGPCIKPCSCPKECTESNEEYNECGSSCPTTCENYNKTIICSALCQRGCFCKLPFIMDEKRRKCVEKKDCYK